MTPGAATGMAGNAIRTETVRFLGYSQVHALSAPSARQALGVYMKSLQADRPATQLKIPEWAAPTPPLVAGIRRPMHFSGIPSDGAPN